MYNKEILNVHKTFMEVSNDFNKLVIEKNNKKFTKIIE
jgi:hypothetical protein